MNSEEQSLASSAAQLEVEGGTTDEPALKKIQKISSDSSQSIEQEVEADDDDAPPAGTAFQADSSSAKGDEEDHESQNSTGAAAAVTATTAEDKPQSEQPKRKGSIGSLFAKQAQKLKGQKQSENENGTTDPAAGTTAAIAIEEEEGEGGEVEEEAAAANKKKNTSRCKVCKKGGTPSSFKSCKECSRLFHLDCINMKKEESSRKYICEGCKEKTKQKRAVEREKEQKKRLKEKEKEKERQLKIDAVLISADQNAKPSSSSNLGDTTTPTPSTNSKPASQKAAPQPPREKPKSEGQLLFEQFQRNYPHLIENRKVKFPIEDTLFDVYSKAFDSVTTSSSHSAAAAAAAAAANQLGPRPDPIESTVIPACYFGDILMIWNFIATFSEHLDNVKLTKEQLYVLLENDGTSSEECAQTLATLLKNLIRFPMLDIFFSHKIDNNKELSEQPFFIAARFAKETDQLEVMMPQLWPEFIRNLSTLNQYSLNFKDEESVKEILEIIGTKEFSGFNDLKTPQRIKLLSMVIACVDDSDNFHDSVIGNRQEQVHEMTKERNDLLVEIKKEESELLALEAKFKALEAEMKIEPTQTGATAAAPMILDQVSRAETLKKQKELERDKKELIKQQNIVHKAEQSLNKKKQKSHQLSLDLPHFINTAQLLGFDKFKSEYWFFHNERKSVYVRFVTEKSKWGFFNTADSIKGLILSLNKKGLREKVLHENLMYLVKNGYLSAFPELDNIDKKQQSSSHQPAAASLTSQTNISPAPSANSTAKKETTDSAMVIEGDAGEQKTTEIPLVSPEVIVVENPFTAIEPSKEDIFTSLLKQVAAQTNIQIKKKKQLTQAEKDFQIFERAKANMKDIKELILHIELAFSTFLETRKCRWANKAIRLRFREQVQECAEPKDFQPLLEQLNEKFLFVDHMYLKEPKHVETNNQNNNAGSAFIVLDEEDVEQQSEEDQVIGSDDEDDIMHGFQKSGRTQTEAKLTFDALENHSLMRCKKLQMRIWGSQGERIKKSWQSLEVSSVVSAYFSSYLFCVTVHRFLQRKNEQRLHPNQQRFSHHAEDVSAAASSNAAGSTTGNSKKNKKLTDYDFQDEPYLRRSHRQKDTGRMNLAEPVIDIEDEEDDEDNDEENNSSSEESEDESGENQKNNKRRQTKTQLVKGKKPTRQSSSSSEEEFRKSAKTKQSGGGSIEQKKQKKIETYIIDEDDENEEDSQEDDVDDDEQIDEEEDHDEYSENDDDDDINHRNQKATQQKKKPIIPSNSKKNNSSAGAVSGSGRRIIKNSSSSVAATKPSQTNLKKQRGRPSKQSGSGSGSNAVQDDESSEEVFVYGKKTVKPVVVIESEEQDDDDEDEEESNDSSSDEVIETKKAGGSKKVQSSQRLKSSKSSKNDSDDRDQDYWNDECSKCNQGGQVILCDSCPQVFHLKCLSLKAVPSGTWNCLDCQSRMQKQRQTRSQIKLQRR